jgi:outer membrane protein TolC
VAVEQYNQSIVGALKEIADQVVRMRSLDTQLKDAQRSVATANKTYQLAREGYRRGLTDYVNVLIAQTQLLRAQEGVAKVQAGQLQAHATLVTALGGGVIDPSDGPSQKDVLPAHGKGKKSDSAKPDDKATASAMNGASTGTPAAH